jgi:hypothetical protein
MKVRVSGLLMAVVLLSAAACGVSGTEVMVGSGRPATKQFDYKGFTVVDARGGLKVDVQRADKFDVSVSADDNVLRFVKVSTEGDMLTVEMEPGKNVHSLNGLHVAIAMPQLDAVKLDGACTCAVSGFTGAKAFHAQLNGASRLRGTIDADKIDLDTDGSSSAVLNGKAKEGTLTANGASELDLGGLAFEQASVRFSGGSGGSVYVNGPLDYDLSGASRLIYDGHPTLGKQEATGGSSAAKKKKPKPSRDRNATPADRPNQPE